MPANPALGRGRTRTNKTRKRKRKQNADAVAIVRAQRVAEWLDLRLQGFTFQQIGDAQTPKVSKQRVAEVINDYIRKITIEPAEDLKKLQDMRLEALFVGNAERAMSGDGWAIDRALAILDRKAQLHGLNAPQKVQTEEIGPVAQAKTSLLRKLNDMANKFAAAAPVTIDATPVAEALPAPKSDK